MTKLGKVDLSSKDIDAILEAFDKPGVNDYTIIRSVLELCPKRIKVQFALDSCNSIRHLMKDKRSTDVLDHIQIYLDTGKPVPEEIRKAAAAAHAADAAAADAADAAAYAYAAAAYAYAAAHAAHAAYAAADAADAAAYAYAAAAAYAYAAAAAYAYAADAAYAYAADAAQGTPEWNRVKAERMREHLNRLKDLILQHVPAEYDNFLLQVAL